MTKKLRTKEELVDCLTMKPGEKSELARSMQFPGNSKAKHTMLVFPCNDSINPIKF
jgi:hypothetical protein